MQATGNATRRATRWASVAGAVLLGAALPGAVTVAGAQPPFEGVVTMRMGSPRPAAGAAAAPATQELEYYVSGGRLRMNMAGPAGGMAVLVMPAEKKMYMLVAAQHAYMEMPMADVAATAARASQAPENVKVTRTGKFETIAGYRCEHVLMTATGSAGAAETTDACIARELGGFTNPLQGMGGRTPAWQKAVEAQGFPLKVTTPEGTVALEVTKIEKKRLANTLFTIPESYTRMPMPARR